MRRGRLLILVGLILIFGLIAVYFVVLPLLSPAEQPTDNGQVQQPAVTEMSDVVIVQQAISRGEEISEGKVAVVQIPRDRAFAGMFTALDQVIGKKSLFDLEQGAFLTEAMVSDAKVEFAGSEASLYIEQGMLAVSIPINRLNSVSYGLRPGDRVNVIVSLQFVDLDTQFQSVLPNYSSAVIAPGPAIVVSFSEASDVGSTESASVTTNELLQTLTAQIVAGGTVSPIGRLDLDPTLGQPFYIVPSETQRPRSVSQTLIQNAMVLQVGTFDLPGQAEAEAAAQAAQEQAAAEAEAAGEQPPPEAVPVIVPPDVITLVVSYQDAVTLNYLILNNAKLSLAMRPAEDATISETEAVTLQFLLDQYNIFVPAKQPYGLEPRIDTLQFPALPNDQNQNQNQNP